VLVTERSLSHDTPRPGERRCPTARALPRWRQAPFSLLFFFSFLFFFKKGNRNPWQQPNAVDSDDPASLSDAQRSDHDGSLRDPEMFVADELAPSSFPSSLPATGSFIMPSREDVQETLILAPSSVVREVLSSVACAGVAWAQLLGR
jgi:hypothetical protein